MVCLYNKCVFNFQSVTSGHLPRERSGRWSKYSFQSSEDCSKLEEHPEEREDHTEESFDERNDLTEEEGVDSDACCFDTIPFSESEYEKIVDDAGVQTDDSFHGKVSPELYRHHRHEGHGSMDTGIDSALGRSVSDHSINTEALAASQAKLSDQVTQAFEKKAGGAIVRQMDMRAAPGVPAPMSPTQLAQRMIIRPENHDIGYSSESHSNEEVEFLTGQAVQVTATKMVTGSDRDQKETSNSSDENVVVHRTPKDSRGSGNNNQGSPLHSKWRHSMTSAYDTSSNCSELASHYDLEATVDTSNDNTNTTDTNDNQEIQDAINAEVHQAVSRFISSPPDRHVYKLTTIETDSELSSAADCKPSLIHGEVCKSGADTDAESDQLSKSLDLPFDDVSLKYGGLDPNMASSPKSPSGMPTSRVKIEKLFGAGDLPVDESLEVVEEYERSLESEGEYYEDNIDLSHEGGHALFEMEEDGSPKPRSDSLLVIVPDSDTNQRDTALTEDELNANTQATVADLSPVGSDSVSKLVRQAEQLARDGNLGGSLSHSQWYTSQSLGKKKHRSKHKRKHDESFTSTEGSGLTTSENSNPSSCDASSEGTASESESDFSTASSDGEDVAANGSAVLAQDTTLNASPCQCTPTKGAEPLPSYLMAKRRGEVTSSAGELYGASHELDLVEFSISESAINDLQSNQTSSSYSHKLRRTTSETSHLTLKRYDTPPRRHKRRKLKRSASDESKEGSNTTSPSKQSASPSKTLYSSEDGGPVSPGASSNTLTNITPTESRQHVLMASSPKPISGRQGTKTSATWNLSDLSGSELEKRRYGKCTHYLAVYQNPAYCINNAHALHNCVQMLCHCKIISM